MDFRSGAPRFQRVCDQQRESDISRYFRADRKGSRDRLGSFPGKIGTGSENDRGILDEIRNCDRNVRSGKKYGIEDFGGCGLFLRG